MPVPNILDIRAKERGQSIAQMIDDLLTEHGTPFKVAMALGVYENSIRYYLRRRGYRFICGAWQKPQKVSSDN